MQTLSVEASSDDVMVQSCGGRTLLELCCFNLHPLKKEPPETELHMETCGPRSYTDSVSPSLFIYSFHSCMMYLQLMNAGITNRGECTMTLINKVSVTETENVNRESHICCQCLTQV